jgi:hypothetical protein
MSCLGDEGSLIVTGRLVMCSSPFLWRMWASTPVLTLCKYSNEMKIVRDRGRDSGSCFAINMVTLTHFKKNGTYHVSDLIMLRALAPPDRKGRSLLRRFKMDRDLPSYWQGNLSLSVRLTLDGRWGFLRRDPWAPLCGRSKAHKVKKHQSIPRESNNHPCARITGKSQFHFRCL